MAYLCNRTQEHRQHQNKTTSRTQGFTSVEVFLMLRSASLTWGRRRQKLMNFHFVTIWCQMSNSLKSWRLPVFVPRHDKVLWKGQLSSCSETPPFLCHPNPLDVVLCWADMRQTGICGAFVKPQGTVTPRFTLARLSCPFIPSCKIRNM